MIGRAEVSESGDLCVQPGASEATLRDSLADYAHLHGWHVQTEHVVPGWGRPDLYVTAGDVVVAVELKLELCTPSAIRKGFQQADVYRRCLPEARLIYLCAHHVNREMAAPYLAAFQGIQLCTVSQLMTVLSCLELGIERRRMLAAHRLADAEERVQLHRLAAAAIPADAAAQLGTTVEAVLAQ